MGSPDWKGATAAQEAACRRRALPGRDEVVTSRGDVGAREEGGLAGRLRSTWAPHYAVASAPRDRIVGLLPPPASTPAVSTRGALEGTGW
ncbi:hypothetical protein D3C74_391860 [compost metagenome]